VVLRKPVTVILRYPTTGTRVLRSTDSGWIVLPSTNVHTGMQNVAETDRVGVFAAAGPVGGGVLVFSGGLPRGPARGPLGSPGSGSPDRAQERRLAACPADCATPVGRSQSYFKIVTLGVPEGSVSRPGSQAR